MHLLHLLQITCRPILNLYVICIRYVKKKVLEKNCILLIQFFVYIFSEIRHILPAFTFHLIYHLISRHALISPHIDVECTYWNVSKWSCLISIMGFDCHWTESIFRVSLLVFILLFDRTELTDDEWRLYFLLCVFCSVGASIFRFNTPSEFPEWNQILSDAQVLQVES